MKNFKEKYPVWLSIAVIILYLISDFVIGMLWVFVPENFATKFIGQFVMMLVPFLFVVFFSSTKVYRDKGMDKTLSAGAFMLVVQAMLVWANVQLSLLDETTKWASFPDIVYGVVVLFGIGFREESLFRGIVVNNIAKKYITDRKGIYITIIISGVIFGAIHMTNIFVGVDVFSAFIQSVVAMGIGFYLGAVYLRGGSLWGLILLHSITDAASLFYSIFTTNNGTEVDTINELGWGNLAPLLLFGAITLFLLRKDKCEEIIERFKKEDASL